MGDRPRSAPRGSVTSLFTSPWRQGRRAHRQGRRDAASPPTYRPRTPTTPPRCRIAPDLSASQAPRARSHSDNPPAMPHRTRLIGVAGASRAVAFRQPPRDAASHPTYRRRRRLARGRTPTSTPRCRIAPDLSASQAPRGAWHASMRAGHWGMKTSVTQPSSMSMLPPDWKTSAGGGAHVDLGWGCRPSRGLGRSTNRQRWGRSPGRRGRGRWWSGWWTRWGCPTSSSSQRCRPSRSCCRSLHTR